MKREYRRKASFEKGWEGRYIIEKERERESKVLPDTSCNSGRDETKWVAPFPLFDGSSCNMVIGMIRSSLRQLNWILLSEARNKFSNFHDGVPVVCAINPAPYYSWSSSVNITQTRAERYFIWIGWRQPNYLTPADFSCLGVIQVRLLIFRY